MKDSFSFDVCGMRKFGRFKVSDVAAVYLRFVLLFVFCICNAKQLARALVASNVLLILHVHRTRNFAKICKAVVRWVAIDMIKMQGWPHAVAIEPRKPVRVELVPIENNFAIPVCSSAAARCANRHAAAAHKASENACLGIVRNHLTQAREGYTFSSHDAVLSRSGQGLSSGCTLAGPRLV